MEKKFAFLLVNEKGYAILKKLTESFAENIGVICSYSEKNVSENYFEIIAGYCADHSVTYIEKKMLMDYLKAAPNISGILAVGWQYLLPRELDRSFEYGIHVFHDSLLPRYRGFSPTPSAIINGEPDIGVTLLRVGDGIDNGPVFGQKKFELGMNDYVKDAISKLTDGYISLMNDFLNMVNSGAPIRYIVQDEANATYSIWRDEDDYTISWDRAAIDIRNQIRATGSPYLGASSYYNEKKVRIFKADLQTDIQFELRNPGKVWKIIDDSTVDVVCGSGILRLTDVFFDDTKEKVKFTKLRSRFI